MIYLDNAATSFHKPPTVSRSMLMAMQRCANPGRGGYPAAMEAAETVFRCRETAASLFHCSPEQVAFTSNCTHGLNIAINTLVKPGGKVLISGFEHNAVTRPLYALDTKILVAGRRLFDWEDTLEDFSRKLKTADAAVFTHISNVFGYVLPVEQMAKLCRERGIPFVIDAAQSAGVLPVSLTGLGADFIAMPGHKGLLGPQGTGLLLCRDGAEPLLFGGTGSDSLNQRMPDDLPDRLEAGTMNVPGIAGLTQGLRFLRRVGADAIFAREHRLMKHCVEMLKTCGMKVYSGPHQAATVSFLPGMDCEEAAAILARRGIAVRAGFHCAPLAHQSAGTDASGTVRVSLGYDTNPSHLEGFFRAATKLPPFRD